MARRAYIRTFAVTLALVLLSVPSNYGQPTACVNKVSECTSLVGSGVPDSNSAALQFCSSVFPTLTECVSQAKSICTNPTFYSALDNILDSLEPLCADGAQCTLSAAQCMASIQSAMPDFTSSNTSSFDPSVLQQVCPAMQQVKTCFEGLEAQCKNSSQTIQFIQLVDQMSGICATLTDSGQCTGAFSCITSVADANMDCSTLTSVLNCVKGKVQEGSCNVNQSGLSYSDLETMVNELCTEMQNFSNADHNCSALSQCILGGFGLTLSNLNVTTLLSHASTLVSPTGLCRFVEIGTSCYGSQASACGYTQSLVSAMTAQQAKFNDRCPKSDDEQCMMSAAQCMANIQSSVPGFTSLDMSNFDVSVLQQVCPAMQQVKTCFEGLDAQCNTSNQIIQHIQMVNQISGICATLTESGQCTGAFSCITSVADANMDCSTLTTVLNCVKSKVQEGSCNVNQSGLSYSDLETMVNELCTEMQNFSNADYNCSALSQCVLGGFGLTLSNLNVTTLLSLASRLVSPKGLCRYVEIGTGCFGSHASACGYTQSLVSAMTAQQTKFNDRCPKSDDEQCMMSAAQCMANIQSSVPGFTSLDMSNFDVSVLQQACPALQQVKTCLEGLDAQCKNSNQIIQFIQLVNQMSGICATLTDSGQCTEAFSCITSVADANMDCSTLTTVLNCVKSKVQEGSCNVDQSGLSYSDLETMVNELCTEMQNFSNADHNCSALSQCVLGGFGLTLSNLNVTTLLSLASRLVSPKGLCRYAEIGTGCYGSQASACGYTQSLVSAMTSLHTKFSDRCPKSDDTQCMMAAAQCMANIQSSLPDFTSLDMSNINVSVLQQVCPALQQVKTCFEGLDAQCKNSSQTIQHIQLVNQMSGICATSTDDVQCMMSAAQCMANIQSSVPGLTSLDMSNFDVSVLQQACPALQQVMTCLEGLDAQCKSSNLIIQHIQLVNQMSGICATLTDGGQCPGVFPCVTSVTYANMNCSTLTTVLSCVKGKVQEGSCNVDQSGISYSDLETMVNEFCTAMQPFSNVDHDCSALSQCVLGGFGITSSNHNVTTFLSFASRLASPKGLCGYVEMWTGCYGTQASACGYTQALVSMMTAQHTKFNGRCPRSGGDGKNDTDDNGSTGQTVSTMSLSLAVIIALLFF